VDEHQLITLVRGHRTVRLSLFSAALRLRSLHGSIETQGKPIPQQELVVQNQTAVMTIDEYRRLNAALSVTLPALTYTQLIARLEQEQDQAEVDTDTGFTVIRSSK
jgi:hypothetical protein